MNFNQLSTSELDRNLTPEERSEWNAIYASYQAQSLLTGEVSGVDSYAIGEDGNPLLAAVIIAYRVKVLIPHEFLWNEPENIPGEITRNILGAKIDYVIKEIDRKNNVCVASRTAAMQIRRKKFFKGRPKIGNHVKCNVLAVGMKRMFVEVHGHDLKLMWRDVRYSAFTDFRVNYSTGQVLPAVITSVNKRRPLEEALAVSVRKASPHPYVGLQKRHPIHSRRKSVIIGKYKGLIFCKLEEDYDCLCRYSAYHSDDDFQIGDNVIIVISEYDDNSKRVYGMIVSKWR
jgi:ribosomal protein S1